MSRTKKRASHYADVHLLLGPDLVATYRARVEALNAGCPDSPQWTLATLYRHELAEAARRWVSSAEGGDR